VPVASWLRADFRRQAVHRPAETKIDREASSFSVFVVNRSAGFLATRTTCSDGSAVCIPPHASGQAAFRI